MIGCDGDSGLIGSGVEVGIELQRLLDLPVIVVGVGLVDGFLYFLEHHRESSANRQSEREDLRSIGFGYRDLFHEIDNIRPLFIKGK